MASSAARSTSRHQPPPTEADVLADVAAKIRSLRTKAMRRRSASDRLDERHAVEADRAEAGS